MFAVRDWKMISVKSITNPAKDGTTTEREQNDMKNIIATIALITLPAIGLAEQEPDRDYENHLREHKTTIEVLFDSSTGCRTFIQIMGLEVGYNSNQCRSFIKFLQSEPMIKWAESTKTREDWDLEGSTTDREIIQLGAKLKKSNENMDYIIMRIK